MLWKRTAWGDEYYSLKTPDSFAILISTTLWSICPPGNLAMRQNFPDARLQASTFCSKFLLIHKCLFLERDSVFTTWCKLVALCWWPEKSWWSSNKIQSSVTQDSGPWSYWVPLLHSLTPLLLPVSPRVFRCLIEHGWCSICALSLSIQPWLQAYSELDTAQDMKIARHVRN